MACPLPVVSSLYAPTSTLSKVFKLPMPLDKSISIVGPNTAELQKQTTSDNNNSFH